MRRVNLRVRRRFLVEARVKIAIEEDFADAAGAVADAVTDVATGEAMGVTTPVTRGVTRQEATGGNGGQSRGLRLLPWKLRLRS
jgi:hypothetical protein